MKERIEALLAEVNELHCKKVQEIEEARVRLLGKKGEITRLFEEFRDVAPQMKKEFGKSLNALKTAAMAKIEELRRDGTLRDLQGVLYFTDGKGTYPTRRPPYEIAFLFLETGTPPPDTPPWAMRLVLSPEEFLPDPVPKTPEIDWQENEAEDLPEL